MAIIDNITSIYHSLKSRSILQNYTWMTILNIVSPLIGVILYPFVIRKTGSDSYGLFVFAQSVIQYAVQLVSFGFDVPAAKTIAQNKTDKALQSKLVTHVLAMKALLSLIAITAFLPFVFTLPILSDNKPIFLWSITLIVAELFNLQFFFQGIGKMRVMSIMSLVFRIMMIPAVFLLIDGPEDNVTYMIITGVTLSAGPVCNFLWMIWKEGISLTPLNIPYAKGLIREALPFLCTYFFGQLKTSTLTVLIGVFISMSDVAIFDLGNKIVNIFRNFTTSINITLFPEVVSNANRNSIKRIIHYETIISLIVMGIILIFGYPMVLILGGHSMTMAYPVAIILSFNIYAYLITGAYLNFVFVPSNKYYFVTIEQIIACVSCLSLFLLFATLFNAIAPEYIVLSVALGMAASSALELVFCRYADKKCVIAN